MVPSSTDEAVNLLRLAYNNRDNLNQLGNNGYNYCKIHFSSDIVLQKYIDTLKILLNG